jgi:esterase/lipase superfamily enzyme
MRAACEGLPSRGYNYPIVNREHHGWRSPRLNRHLELLIFGHSGIPVLVFPTTKGRYYEYEDRGMIGANWHKFANGELQAFCVDSVDAESWYNRGAHPGYRVHRHYQYESYVLEEVVPLIRARNSNPNLVAHGCSFGGFHAAMFAFRHPEIFSHLCSLSGAFDGSGFLNGYKSDNAYFLSPEQFVPNISDHHLLERFRRMHIYLGTSNQDICMKDNFNMAHILGVKGIPHHLDVWEGYMHDWPLWRAQVAKFFGPMRPW